MKAIQYTTTEQLRADLVAQGLVAGAAAAGVMGAGKEWINPRTSGQNAFGRAGRLSRNS